MHGQQARTSRAGEAAARRPPELTQGFDAAKRQRSGSPGAHRDLPWASRAPSSSNNKMLFCQAHELRQQLPARSMKSQPELSTGSAAAPFLQRGAAGAAPVPRPQSGQRNRVRAQGETQQRNPMRWETGTQEPKGRAEGS